MALPAVRALQHAAWAVQASRIGFVVPPHVALKD
jgi:hypothetical protein